MIIKRHRANVLTVTFGLLILVAVFFWVYQVGPLYPANQAILKPVESISYQFHNHIHGLGYDSQNQQLWIATHYGIFIWKEGKLFQLGESRDDFMGFSLHPSNPNTIYTSGHPKSGGNMGVMKSEDGGASFKRIFQGVLGETVDFHSMTISPANPRILYGFFMERLYRSKDGGESWQLALGQGLFREGFCFGVPCLSADSQNERIIYAGAPNGLLVSHDYGEIWTVLNSQLGAVAGTGIDLSNPQRLFAFTQNLGLASSRDGGKSWRSSTQGLQLSPKEFIFAFAFDRKNSKHVFAATPEKVFRTRDGGESWERTL